MLADKIYVADYSNKKPVEKISEEEAWFRKRELMGANYAALFNSELGKIVLKDLVDKFLTRPIATPADTMIQVGIREGRADIVRQILQIIDHTERNNNGR